MIFTFGNCGKNRGKYHYLLHILRLFSPLYIFTQLQICKNRKNPHYIYYKILVFQWLKILMSQRPNFNIFWTVLPCLQNIPGKVIHVIKGKSVPPEADTSIYSTDLHRPMIYNCFKNIGSRKRRSKVHELYSYLACDLFLVCRKIEEIIT